MKLNKILLIACLLCLGSLQNLGPGEKHKAHHPKSHSFHRRIRDDPTPGSGPSEKTATNSSAKALLPDILPDNNGDGQSDYKEFTFAFQNSGLSQQQIKYVFQFVDKNKDNNIGRDDWSSFVQLFLRPYKKICKADPGPELTLQQLNECILADPNLPFRGIDKSKLSDSVFDAMDKDKAKSKFNFMDYIFLRRAHLAWKNCAVDGRLSLDQMDCGLHITQGQNYPVARRLYIVGQMLFRGTLNETSFMDFGTFLHVAHIYYYFWNFQPADGQHLSWSEILKGIRDQALPLYINPDIVQQMFLSVDPTGNKSEVLDFANFVTLISLYRKFERNCLKKIDSLSQEEFLKILLDKTFNQDIIAVLNSTVVPTLEEVTKAASSKRKPKATEEDYIISFLEIQQRPRHGHKGIFRHNRRQPKTAGAPPGTTNPGKAVPAASISISNRPPNNMLQIAFNIFTPNYQNGMRFVDFIAFNKLSWSFIQFDTNRDGYISVPELQQGLINYYSPISLNKIELKKFGELVQNEPDTSFNIKELFNYMYYDAVFAPLLVPGNPRHIVEAALKAGFEKLSLFITEDVTDASRESNVSVNQDVYNYDKAAITGIYQDIEAVRQIRIGFNYNSSNSTGAANGNPASSQGEPAAKLIL